MHIEVRITTRRRSTICGQSTIHTIVDDATVLGGIYTWAFRTHERGRVRLFQYAVHTKVSCVSLLWCPIPISLNGVFGWEMRWDSRGVGTGSDCWSEAVYSVHWWLGTRNDTYVRAAWWKELLDLTFVQSKATDWRLRSRIAQVTQRQKQTMNIDSSASIAVSNVQTCILSSVFDRDKQISAKGILDGCWLSW